MFCPKCGANVPENQAFCAGCGNKMAPAAPAAAPAAKPAKKISRDAMLVYRIAVVILAVLSIILIFSKGIGIHFEGGETTTICEWDYYFDNCDSSKALPITFQVISVVLVSLSAIAMFLPMFLPQLKRIKLYNLIPAAVAALNLILYIILIIVALAIFEGGSYAGAHPASASWFYILDLVALGALSYKMFKDGK